VSFVNLKVSKYFEGRLHPYIGIGLMNSGSQIFDGREGWEGLLFGGINFRPLLRYPLNISLEVRNMTITLEKEMVEFNNYGDSKILTINTESRGVGVLASVVYLF